MIHEISDRIRYDDETRYLELERVNDLASEDYIFLDPAERVALVTALRLIAKRGRLSSPKTINGYLGVKIRTDNGGVVIDTELSDYYMTKAQALRLLELIS